MHSLLVALTLLPQAQAVSLGSPVSTDSPKPGITITKYRTSSPVTNLWVARVDLCQRGIYVDATRASGSTQSTGGWASDQGVTLATNGDFYKTGPLRVYGDAVGGGVRWPSLQTGWHSNYQSEWYWERYGWIAFGHDWVDFTHTGWVKANVSGLTSGWRNDDPTPPLPDGTLALVSGFPELVTEGRVVTCSSATASSCFPDRGDMRDRHPRMAMGITQDRTTMMWVVVDGRTSSSAGMYGAELADVMGQLGAWQAFNLDGGGSAQMWVQGDSYINDISGNNNGSGTRSVANHWGVYAGNDDGLPQRPGHCATAAPCEVLPATGGTLDDGGACFRGFGPSATWRTVSGGTGGSFRWTNAFSGSQPDNWAWWQVNLAEAGTYRVEAWVDATYGVHRATNYSIRHDGADSAVTIDQGAASGWRTLGEWRFAAGGGQWVALTDHVASGGVASSQHITADAIRLVRLDPSSGGGGTGGQTSTATGGGTDTQTSSGTGGTSTGTPDDTAGDAAGGAPDSDASPDAPDGATWDTGPLGWNMGKDDCGCAGVPAPGSAWTPLAALALLWRRRRR
jgi:MYXO-CTERM domain-containing protein